MEKEEILEKAKKSGQDERERQIEVKSSSLGAAAVTVVIGIFIVFNRVKGQESRDLLAILLSYWSVQYFYKYKQLESKMFLTLGCIAAIGFAAAAVSYLVWG